MSNYRNLAAVGLAIVLSSFAVACDGGSTTDKDDTDTDTMDSDTDTMDSDTDTDM
ncbi:MAG: hypothetical protein H6733_00725 [Alphaproteobacteria bacterium]|nr:hypothetical protein [Alphaproteobacteria bacterium]